MDWEFGVGRCKLLHLEWINNKLLMCSTRNYTQYLIINYKGKEYIYVYIYVHACVCITESLLLYNRDRHIENQLYFNKKCKKKSGLSFCHLPPIILKF